MKSSHPTSIRTHGFTLIELSIVLVIIGLIVGGVLVGRDLIEAAQVRSTVSQKEQFDAAVNTFKMKYNCLPGDCKNASQFGLGGYPIVSGNGRLDGGWEEITSFWIHLHNADLIKVTTPYAGVGQICLGQHTPKTKLKQGGIGSGCKGSGWAVTVFSTEWISYFGDPAEYSPEDLNNAHNFVIAQEWGDGTTAGTITPSVAFQMDSKMDDGLPLSGSVRAGPYQTLGDGAIQAYFTTNTIDNLLPEACVNSDVTPRLYNFASTGFVCSLLIKSSL